MRRILKTLPTNPHSHEEEGQEEAMLGTPTIQVSIRKVTGGYIVNTYSDSPLSSMHAGSSTDAVFMTLDDALAYVRNVFAGTPGTGALGISIDTASSEETPK